MNKLSEIDWQSVASDLLTLLDRIEIEDDPSLANQRHDIAEKHGMAVEFGEQVSGRFN